MRLVQSTRALLITIVFASVAMGQEAEPSASYEHLKAYESLIGTWKYDGPTLETTVGFDAGIPLLIHFSWNWTLDKNAIEFNWAGSVDNGALKLSGKQLVSWNAATKQIIGHGCSSTGNSSDSIVTVSDEGTRITLKTKQYTSDGEEQTSGTVIQLIGKNTLKWKIIDRKDEDLPAESPWYEFKRVKPTKTSKHYFEYWKPLSGEWNSETTVAGEVTEGTLSYQPSPTNRCYAAVSTSDNQPERHDVHGYDPGLDSWVATGFNSDGSREMTSLKITNWEDVTQLGSGAKGAYETTKVASDGSKSVTTGKWTWTEFDGQQGTLRLENVSTDGEKQPDIEVKMVRVK